jgi:Protein of unknown function (DUF2783)
MTAIGEDRLKGDGDAVYARLMAAHHGLSGEDSARLNARLVLILANLVGDRTLIEAAIAKAAELPER